VPFITESEYILYIDTSNEDNAGINNLTLVATLYTNEFRADLNLNLIDSTLAILPEFDSEI